MQVKRILFPVDSSQRCHGAAHYVRAFARCFEAEVIALHVVDLQYSSFGVPEVGILPGADATSRIVEQKQLELNTVTATELPGLKVMAQVKAGEAAAVILDVARDLNPDLVMMPTHGYGPFRRFLMGSVTAKVLHDAHCPVWTGVHMEGAPPLERIGFENIICALDLDHETGVRTLRAAVEFAGQTGAKVWVVHAIPAIETRPEKYFDTQFHSFLHTVADEEIGVIQRAAGTQFPICVHGGQVARVVREAALNHNANLVMIGRSSHDLLGRLRTHGYAIVRESPCPVISI